MALTHVMLNMDVFAFANSANQYDHALKKSVDWGATLCFTQTVNIVGNK